MQAQTADSTEVEKLDAVVAEESATDATEDVDVNALVFGHIGDAYEWHIATIGDTSVRIPLPVIVKSSTGWHCFSSFFFPPGRRGDLRRSVHRQWRYLRREDCRAERCR